MIDTDRERSDHFGETALRQTAQQLHLREAEMGVDQTKGDREIVVGLRLDKRYQVPVPGNLNGAVDRSPLLGHRCEPLLDCLSPRPVAKAGHSEPQRQADRAVDDCGRWQHVGSNRGESRPLRQTPAGGCFTPFSRG